MLETPLYGRFIGENRKLVFGPVGPYHALVRTCVIGGAIASCLGFVAPSLGIDLPIYPQWWFLTGLAVCLAGILAAYSLQSVVFDLRERTYRRRQGPGLLKSTTRGSLSDLDAVVLIAEPKMGLSSRGVTYHLILHWKTQKEQPLVLQQDTRTISPGLPLNTAAAPLLQKGMLYARALGLPIYDNSHFASSNPFPLLR